VKQLRLKLVALLIVSCVPAWGTERVHIAVFGLFHPRALTVEVLSTSPLVVDAGGKQFVAGVNGPQSVPITWHNGKLQMHSIYENQDASRITFSAHGGGEAEFYLAVPGRMRRRYRGNLVVIAGSRELVPVVDVELETAVASIVAAELPANTPFEALKAQAVVSRSYLVSGGHRHTYSDFCDSTHCQFFREPPSLDSPAVRAARATAGLVLAWKGHSFPAMFSASCGGRTHSLSEVGYTAADYPYFAVECPYCHNSPERWQTSVSAKDAESLANSETARIRAGRRLGWHAVESNTYTKTKTSGGVKLSGIGRGHGIGLCQRGAVSMARAGKGFRSILDWYFPNTTILGSIR
jgi:stage II sporulation protein D